MDQGRHLIDSHDREDVAVERLLNILPFLHPSWYESIGIDHNAHWALVRPLLREPLPGLREAEIDIVFGRMSAVTDRNGYALPIWPPPTDYLVAVEAKCQVVTPEDLEPWAGAAAPKSNLRQQLERNLELGFHRVAALHIVATPPSADYWDVLAAATTLGTHYLPIADGYLFDFVEKLPVGHAVMAIAGVDWKHEGLSGTVLPMKMVAAPQTGFGLRESALSQIKKFVAECPAPTGFRAHFTRTKKKWLPMTAR